MTIHVEQTLSQSDAQPSTVDFLHHLNLRWGHRSLADRLEEAINRLQSEIRDSLDIQRDILLAMLEILRVKKPKVKFVLSH